MPDRNDSQLDRLLSEHFARELDSQLGRAGARFMAESEAPQPIRLADAAHAHPPHRHRSQWSGLAWTLGLAGGAVAAGIAMVMVLTPMIRNGHPAAPAPIVMGPTTSADDLELPRVTDLPGLQNFEHALTWSTIDQGTVYLDSEMPLRSVVRQADETMRWYDPQREAHVEMRVPRDQVMLVGYQSQ